MSPLSLEFLKNWKRGFDRRRRENRPLVSFVDSAGSTVANYTYDAWGKLLSVKNASGATITSSTHIAIINPIRYRGYYYDAETGWYYLQSRYYDPGLGRFINADCTTNTGQGFIGRNMFAYCLNNPVILFDVKGEDACIVIDSSGAGGFGHVGLFVQDEKGIWYYHSFVAAVSRPKAFVFGILGYSVNGRIEDIELGDGYGYDLESFSGFKNFAIDSKKMEETSASMDTLVYLKGDYTQARAACKSLIDHQISEEGSINPIQYNLRRYNCMHFVSKVLSSSPSLTWQQRLILSRLMKKTVPNWNDETIKKMGRVLK